MQLFTLCCPTLAVCLIYCIWHAYLRHRLRCERTLRNRVAWLLWTAANQTL
jgi:hypothetical protein